MRTSGQWVPAYTCTCVGKRFEIVGTGGGVSDPCPHLHVWKESAFSLFNSVLGRDNLLRLPADDYTVHKDLRPDQSGLVRFRIDQIEPDTTYFYGASLAALPDARDVVVTPDGRLFRVGDALPPIEAIGEGEDILGKIAEMNEDYFVGTKGTTLITTFSGLQATEAMLAINAMKKDVPENPFGEEIESKPGLELQLVGSGGFVTGSDTTASYVLHPRQFASTVALHIVGLKPSEDTMAIRVIWHGEHHVDGMSVCPKPVPYPHDVETVLPVMVKYVPCSETPSGEGEWVYRLVPGDQLYFDFKPEVGIDGEDTAYLLTLTGYFVGPSDLAGVPFQYPLSIRLASPNPCMGSELSGRFSVPSAVRVNLEVYDVRGRLVRPIVRGSMDAGVHAFDWNLKNTSGVRVAPGLYFLRFDTPERTITRKVVIRR